MGMRLIYVHGFNSSERSAKATLIGKLLASTQIDYQVPRLHYDPRIAMMQLEALLTPTTRLIGSSLGGFYATYLSQQYNLPAVVINPAVNPAALLADFLGPQYNPYQDCHYELGAEHVAALAQLYLPTLPYPQQLLLLQQIGDEVLPYLQAVQYYQTTPQRIEFAGDHSFQGLERHLETIVNFLKIT
ncbi:YqiA/YcfP family alpha/beta fold hydrolase [Pseudoalteromonas fenneropenaei]|uniref:YqiA/YcfP family alpha/beta fold hydrolase n=1 Tax=Pseudoalteromonas fenneropenaei TaxID=1737459 RepID=A0ABV7CHF2_9GAMM